MTKNIEKAGNCAKALKSVLVNKDAKTFNPFIQIVGNAGIEGAVTTSQNIN